ncbi:MAG: IclR family transcriptional regulator [Pseudomonadota bacterium]
MTTTEEERRGIQSVEVSAEILSALVRAGQAVRLKEISDIAGMPPSKTHRYLSSFIRSGFVRQDQATGYYDLGPTAIELGLSALARLDVLDQAQSAMKEITNETNTTSILSVWGPNGPIVVRWQRASSPFITMLGLGSILPTLTSATGRTFLAFLPKRLTDDIVTREFAQNKRLGRPAKDATTKRDLKLVLEQVRENQLAWVDSSVIPGLKAVASPILDYQGEATAVISLLGSQDDLLNARSHASRTLKKACKKISLEPPSID